MKIINTIITTLFLLSAWVSAKQVPIEAFSAGLDYSQVKISPSGKYISFVSQQDGKNVLVLFSLEKNELLHMVRFPGNAQVGDHSWVNNERIVMAKEYLRGWTDHPLYYGELFAVNADGSKAKYLVGYRGGEQQLGTRVKKKKALMGTSYILDPLIHDEDNFLILTLPWNNSNEPHTVVYKVNVKTGKRKRVTRSPTKMAGFLTDKEGNVRIAVSTEDSINQRIHTRAVGERKWQEFELKADFSDINLVSFDKTGKKVYITASKSGEAAGVFLMDLETHEVSKIFQDSEVSPKDVWVDPASREFYAIEIEPGFPTYAFVDAQSKISKRLKSLLASLPGEQVQLVSSSENGEQTIIKASSDVNPGTYFLYNSKANQLRKLFSSRSQIDPKQMSTTQPISFKSRDGLQIHGYLTLPLNKEPRNLPLVVMPHGGPHGPRDWWGFDPDAQLLASRGIAVLKVNFRGSGGYGRTFEHAGHQKWGSVIQHDIIDGTKYVIERGYADPKNMCIMGASFGGYSALQSSIIEPDMFKCAIGVVGVYDLPLMFEEGDVAARSSGQRYLTQVLGTDEAKLKAYSPSYNIDKLKAPVLIVHGGDDERAPIEQAEALIDALKKAKHPYEYMLLENEGHGFYKPAHRTKYYKRVLAFLDEHLML